MTSHDRMVLAGMEHGCRTFQWMRTFTPNGAALSGMMSALVGSDPGFIRGVMLSAQMHSERVAQTVDLRNEWITVRHLELVA